MVRFPVRWMEARTYCHSTEDEDRSTGRRSPGSGTRSPRTRGRRDLDQACPGENARRESLEGHFGNTILRLTRRIEGASAVRAAWSRWEEAGVVAALRAGVEGRVDEDGVLHFRLDKQAAFLGSLVLARDRDVIDVRVRILAHPAREETFRQVARELVAEVD